MEVKFSLNTVKFCQTFYFSLKNKIFLLYSVLGCENMHFTDSRLLVNLGNLQITFNEHFQHRFFRHFFFVFFLSAFLAVITDLCTPRVYSIPHFFIFTLQSIITELVRTKGINVNSINISLSPEHQIIVPLCLLKERIKALGSPIPVKRTECLSLKSTLKLKF